MIATDRADGDEPRPDTNHGAASAIATAGVCVCEIHVT
jgi:hypothetical protein